jgi:hypothetical protein
VCDHGQRTTHRDSAGPNAYRGDRPSLRSVGGPASEVGRFPVGGGEGSSGRGGKARRFATAGRSGPVGEPHRRPRPARTGNGEATFRRGLPPPSLTRPPASPAGSGYALAAGGRKPTGITRPTAGREGPSEPDAGAGASVGDCCPVFPPDNRTGQPDIGLASVANWSDADPGRRLTASNQHSLRLPRAEAMPSGRCDGGQRAYSPVFETQFS